MKKSNSSFTSSYFILLWKYFHNPNYLFLSIELKVQVVFGICIK